MRILLLILVGVSLSVHLRSQDQHIIDSLKQVIATAKQDTIRIKTYLNIGEQYERENPDTAIYYYKEGLILSQKNVNNKLSAKCNRYIAYVYGNILKDLDLTKKYYFEAIKYHEQDKDRSNIVDCYLKLGDLYEYTIPDTAISYYHKALNVAEKIKANKLNAKCLKYIGIAHYYQGSFDKALSYYLKSLKIYEEIGNKQGMSDSYNNIGAVYYYQGAYDKAISYYLKSLKVDEELGDKVGMSASYNNIGEVHRLQGSYDKALNYYLKSIKINEEIGNKKGISDSYNNIGTLHEMQGSKNKALSYYLKSLNIKEEIGDKKAMSDIYNNIANIHFEKGSYDQAISYYFKSLKIKEEIGDKNGHALTYGNIAGLNIRLADSIATNEKQRIDYLNKAIENGNKGYKLAKEIGAIIREKETANHLMRAYTRLGKYKKAIEFAQIYIDAKDSLINEKQTKELASLEAKYKYEKQKAIDDANNEKLLAVEKEQQAKQKVISYAIAGGLALVVIFLIFVFNRLRLTRKQKLVIEQQKEQVDEAYGKLEEKNTEILDSINYAKRIQSAILPPAKVVKEYLQESFILYKPKDIVAGDFYWMEHKDGKILFAAADCTGHGVPGAMVSVVCNNALNRSVREHGLTEPGQILDKAREIVLKEFEKSDEEVKDGMDIALCSLEGNKLKYAGANNPLWLIRNGDITATKANKQAIGKVDDPVPYTTHSFELQNGDTLYIFSDGYVDQFGGEKGKKFKSKAFKELLLSIQDKRLEEQRSLLDNKFEAWRGKLEQIDDVCVIGFRF